MASAKEMQETVVRYKRETGNSEVDLLEVADWMMKRGYRAAKVLPERERIAQQLGRALRQEIRHDAKTGRPYRANHAYPVGVTKQGTLWSWIDIDEAPRAPVYKSLQARREQMVGDGLQLTLDADHWNSIHMDEKPIVMEMDFGPDIEWRKNGADEQAV